MVVMMLAVAGSSGIGDGKLTADLTRQMLLDFTVARDRRLLPVGRICEHGVLSALPELHATVSLDVPDEVEALHGKPATSTASRSV